MVTNFHVIRGASEATIRLADGRKFRAALVGGSPENDIAVQKVSPSATPSASTGR